MTTVKAMWGLSSEFLFAHVPKPKGVFVAGAELEVEDVQDWNRNGLAELQIQSTEDGSLRNNGKEFLLPPSTKPELLDRFYRFHRDVLMTGEEPFSARTSTHIHVNMQQSTDAQTKNFLLLYAIFEPLAFAFVGDQRQQNIHCVPLGYTHMPSYYKLNLTTIVSKWHKYTAFNLLPLVEKGTVEFRHLEGTADVGRFSTWLSFIEKLWYTAHKMKDFSVETLTDLTVLRSVEKQLRTPEFHRQCVNNPSFTLEDNLLDVKLAFV